MDDVVTDPFDLLDKSLDDNERAASEDRTRRMLLVAAMRSARSMDGLSQTKVAAAMSTTQSAVSDLESGRTDPQLQTLQRYARAVGGRLDVALVDAGVPTYDEGTANGLWRLVERRSLGALFTQLATRSDELTLRALSESTRLPEPVIAPILDSLERRHWIDKSRQAADTDLVYSLDSRAAYVIGVSLHSDRVEAVLVDLGARVVESRVSRVPSTSYSQVKDAVQAVVAELYSRRDGHEVLGIGVSLAGLIKTDGDRSQTGSIIVAPTLRGTHAESHPWSDSPLEKDLEESLQQQLGNPSLLVAVENDANALAMHEYLKGEQESVMVILMTRTGIGAGYVLRGEVAYGATYSAGELGHLVIDPESMLPCPSGYEHTGCLETVASQQGILQRLGISGESPQDIESGMAHVGRHAVAPDSPEAKTFATAGQEIGKVLATVVALLNPNRVVVYGLSHLVGHTRPRFRDYRPGDKALPAEYFKEGLRSGLLASSPLDKFLAHPEIDFQELRDSTNAIAAARAAMGHFLSDPAHWNPRVQTELVVADVSA